MKLKRFFSLVITLCMMLSITQLPVSAQQNFTLDSTISLSTYVESNFSYSTQSTATDAEGYTTYYVSLPSNPTFAPSEYYANELNDYQKAMYRAFMDGICSIDADDLTLKHKINVAYSIEIEANVTTNQEFNDVIGNALDADWANFLDKALYGAIQYDHTELFWVQGVGYQMYPEDANYSNGVVTVYVVAEMLVDASSLYASDAALVSAAKSMNSTVDSIIENAPTTSEYDMLVYFNNWLKQNNTYNHPHLENDNYPLAHSCISAFVSNNVEAVGPVCQGYAYALKYLCDIKGMNNVVITGDLYQTYSDPGPHAWNAVELDGAWYAIDTTANDSLGTDKYNFLVGSTTSSHDSGYPTFSASHVNDTTHTYPTLSETAYEVGSATPVPEFEYTFDGYYATITKYNGTASVVEIPEEIDDYQVNAIGEDAFKNCTTLVEIIIPLAQRIGNNAFSGCTSLDDVYYQASNFSWITFGEGNECLTNATWHYHDVEGGAGGPGYDLHEMDNGYTDACDDECNVCKYRREAPHTYDGDADLICNGCDNVREAPVATFNYTVENGEVTITRYTGNATEVVIPSTIEGYPVTKIGNSAFFYCPDVVSVSIPNGVKTIEDSAFDTCTSLKSINIPEGVTSIGNGAFQGCTALIFVAIPKSLTNIGDYAFNACSKLNTVFYGGTEAQKSAITVGTQNNYLLNATWNCAEPEYISGDVNGDGSVNNKDLGVLRRFLNDWDVTIDELASDVNRDGAVNNKDLGLLRRYLNDWDVELK